MGSRRSCSTTATAATSIRTGRRSTPGRMHERSGGDPPTPADRGAPSAHGRVVGAAADDGDRARQLHRVFDVGGLPERSLLGAAVPVAVLFAVPVGQMPARDVRLRAARGPAAHHRRAVAGVPDPVGAGSLPPNLLLLPQGVLPPVLALPAGVSRAPPPTPPFVARALGALVAS